MRDRLLTSVSGVVTGKSVDGSNRSSSLQWAAEMSLLS